MTDKSQINLFQPKNKVGLELSVGFLSNLETETEFKKLALRSNTTFTSNFRVHGPLISTSLVEVWG